ncbi:hypothetical protein BDU57DRAFT_521410 [Ampelomyces quisqualis]|uniref:Uncharacterized protein n=1 Tax=Ampelomyces quisqualis TaxID=50730 RepID=A0A6A5QB57_AMPQU|nr:hypothetical protein BDU57DRAFT_521410 [Ampelomyces quisqualis]
MKLIATSSLFAVAVTAAADPQITPRAELAPRQNSDPAFLGWVSASTFTDNRSCDFPATVSRSGSLAQCCSGDSCTFWSSCSAGTLFASQTSLFCDQGYCNTAVLAPTVGASGGQSYLGCWATSLGQSPFTIIADIGSAPQGQQTGSVPGSSGASTARTTSGSTAPSSETPTSPAAGTTSTGAANGAVVQPLTGAFGLVAMVLSLL